MNKKLIIISAAVTLIMLGAPNAFVYANNDTPTQETQIIRRTFKVETPEKDHTTSNRELILSFTAPEGTIVTIEVYHNSSIVVNKETYVLSYDPIEVRVGPLQRAWAEIELRKGLNKIEFTAIYKDGIEEVVTRIITVKDISELKKELGNITNTSTTEVLRNMANISVR